MNPNETTEELPAEEADEGPLQFNEDGKRALADMRWIRQQRRLGHLAAYAGEFVGVFEQQVVGHHRSLIQLRIEVERERGIGPDRLATGYVPDSKGTGVGRMWLA